MKSINEAYDRITKERENGGANYGGDYSQQSDGQNGATGQSYSTAGDPQFAAIRRLISARQLEQANAALDAMTARPAEWYFLKGSVYYARGWYDEARKNYQTACNMDPSNGEYRAAMFRMQTMNAAYRGYDDRTADVCDLCSTMICINCLCNSVRGVCC